MKKIIEKLLYDKKALIEKVEQVDVKNINCSYGISELAYFKWRRVKGLNLEEAFISLLAKWVNVQNTDFRNLYSKNSDLKKAEELLSKLFGTEDFSSLNIEIVEDLAVLDKIRVEMIRNEDGEQLRIKDIRSFKKAKIVEIYSLQNEMIFFGKCSRFYFMISEKYMRSYIVFNDIHDILFKNEKNSWIRKRPGMFIGSIDFVGAHRMILDLVEEILVHSTKKEIEVKILSEDIVEIVCESYEVENNTQVYSLWAPVNELSEFFYFENHKYYLNTEKGNLKFEGVNKEGSSGVKTVFKLDKEIFKDLTLNYYWFLNYFIELASLNPFKIMVADGENKNIIYMPEGAKSLFMVNNVGNSRILSFKFSAEELECEVAFYLSLHIARIQKSFVNNRLTVEGGTHVGGMIKGINSAILRYTENHKEKKRNSLNILSMLNYIISIKISDPRYQGSIKSKLKNIEVEKVVEENIANQLYAEFQKDSELIKYF